MSFASEFKQFAFKGNVVDLAVGVIIGAAFSGFVDSMARVLVMPLARGSLANEGFSNFFIARRERPPGLLQTLKAARNAVALWWHGDNP